MSCQQLHNTSHVCAVRIYEGYVNSILNIELEWDKCVVSKNEQFPGREEENVVAKKFPTLRFSVIHKILKENASCIKNSQWNGCKKGFEFNTKYI